MTLGQIILIPLLFMAIGLLTQFRRMRRIDQDLRLTEDFLLRFVEWCNGRAQDQSAYNWLLDKSERIQLVLGGSGVIDYRPPFLNIIHRKYPVILNEIPAIQSEFHDDLRSFNSIANQNLMTRIQMVDGCLRRFIGSTKDRLFSARTRLFNPLALFCGGIAWLLELPLLVLRETNIISSHQKAIIVNGRLFSLVSGIVSLAALVATVMSIVTGWETFIAIITGWLK